MHEPQWFACVAEAAAIRVPLGHDPRPEHSRFAVTVASLLTYWSAVHVVCDSHSRSRVALGVTISYSEGCARVHVFHTPHVVLRCEVEDWNVPLLQSEHVRAAVLSLSNRVNAALLLDRLHATRVCSEFLVARTRRDDGLARRGSRDAPRTNMPVPVFSPGEFACPLQRSLRLPLHARLGGG